LAIGDTVTDWEDTANGAAMTVQPGAGVEWLIHTIEIEAAPCSVQRTKDGATWTTLDTYDAPGSYHGLMHRANNTDYFRILNNSGSTNFVGYNAVVTK
jgi:hypothetical protein